VKVRILNSLIQLEKMAVGLGQIDPRILIIGDETIRDSLRQVNIATNK
jgi:hypothetical protein